MSLDNEWVIKTEYDSATRRTKSHHSQKKWIKPKNIVLKKNKETQPLEKDNYHLIPHIRDVNEIRWRKRSCRE